jgi:hypothetical protein
MLSGITTLLVVLAILLMSVFYQSEEGFSQLYLSGPTKCFSCERDMINRMGPEYAWMGKQSKCFSCERQMASVHPNLANLTHGTKCFSCEADIQNRERGDGYSASGELAVNV